MSFTPTVPAIGEQTIFGCSDFESTYGTAATVDRFTEILPGETLKLSTKVIQSKGLRGGARNLARGTRRAIANRQAGGDFSLEVATTGMGRFFAALMGGTPVVTRIGVTTAYTHSYPMGAVLGKSVTLQKQVCLPNGTVVQTLTYPGSVLTEGEFSISTDGFLILKLNVDSRDEVDDVSPASASYTNQHLFYFAQASLSIGGSPVANVADASVKISNPQKTDRFFLGNAGLKDQPVDNDFPAVTGQLTAEVLDTGFYDLFRGDTAAAFLMSFVGAEISGAVGHDETLTITVPEVHLTGESPQVKDFGPLENTIPFEGARNPGGSAGATIALVTSDTAV